jgi:hypothetical protein
MAAMNKMTPEELEKFIHRELRGLPPRPAPATLEARVLAAIEHRAAIAWYHKSWTYWPAAVRIAFLVGATALAGALLTAFHLMLNGADAGTIVAQAGERLGFLARSYHVIVWIADFAAQVLGRIPSLWFTGGLALVAALYATFFGLGAFAYRTLYRNN